MKITARHLVAIPLLLALFPVFLLSGIAWEQTRITDEQIAAAAPEDILGLGFTFGLLVLAIPESILLVIVYLFGPSPRYQIAVFVVGLAFIIASIACYYTYIQLYPRVISPAG